MTNKLRLENFNYLSDLYQALTTLDDEKISFDVESASFEQDLIQFLIDKINADNIINTFEMANKIIDLFEKEKQKKKPNYQFTQTRHTLARLEREHNQKSYAHLLESVLEKKPIDTGMTSHVNADDDFENRTLLPDTEFEVPDEPGHWEEVGINETYSFRPTEIEKSILEKFSTSELKTLFTWSFPWAVDLSLAKVKHLTPDEDSDDLLGIIDPMPPAFQFQTIQCLLLCLDVLGKACGKHGELSLLHYDDVKYVTDLCKNISDDLNHYSNEELNEFHEDISRIFNLLQHKNEALLNENLRNKEMRKFCAANEFYAAKILHIDTPSVFTDAK